jgi:type I restriction enzyme, S subunit
MMHPLAKLGSILRLHRGYDITKAEQRDGPFPVISSGGISSYHDEFKFPGPGVVIGRKGSLGTVHFSIGPYWPHDTTLYVEDFKGNHPKFCYYLLKTMGLRQYDVGAANPTLNRNHLHELQAPAPTREIQDRIASILSAYDDLIENNMRRIAILEEMARRIFEEWFVRFRAPGVDPSRLVDSPLGPIPEGWEVVRLDTIIDFDPTTSLPRGAKPFVPMAALSNNSMIVDGVEEREGKSGAKFLDGDTLLARITPCLENGKTGYVDFLGSGIGGFGSTEFIVMRGRQVPPEFVQLLARHEEFRSHAIKSMGGADGRQRVRRDSLEQYEIAVPPTKILLRFSRVTALMFGLVRTLADQNRNLRAQRDLLLLKLISGEIDVSVAEDQIKEAAE